MATQARGTTFAKDGGDTFASLTSIGGLDLSADTTDVTNLSSSSGFREFIAGWKDGGEVTISGFFDPVATHGQDDMLTDFLAQTTDSYIITFPDGVGGTGLGAHWDFDAIITKYTTGAELEDAVTFEATLKVTGVPSLTVDLV